MKKERILDAAENLFAEKGFEGTSVRDIAQQANVNIAMISYYFGSKEKLLQNLIITRTERTTMVLEGLVKNTEMDPWEKIDQVIDFYVDKLLDNRSFHAIMYRQLSLAQDKEITDLLIYVKKRNTAMISEIIRDGQRKKIFRKVDIGMTIGTVMGTISQVSMSKPFYCSILKQDPDDDKAFYKKIRVLLKDHLKSLLKAHLDIKNV